MRPQTASISRRFQQWPLFVFVFVQIYQADTYLWKLDTERYEINRVDVKQKKSKSTETTLLSDRKKRKS